jgi:hypothetical protein
MSWETPSYKEVNMSSEIGGYQDDFEERAPVPGDVAQPPPAQRSGSEG